jgi:LacI family gluconate utilization system Gnt-I transcriptional repressor
MRKNVDMTSERESDAPARTRRKQRRPTMSDVASQAEVSPSTVSLYLRKPGSVSLAAGQSIQRAIDQLNYLPNQVAGGLAAASSRAVSVIVPSIRNAFFAETVSALQTELGKEKVQVLLGHSEYNAREEENLVRAALSWSPAAIVLTGLHHTLATRKLLKAAQTPVVEIWELGEKPIDMAVGFFHRQIGEAVAHHLLARGRRRIAFLAARLQEDRRAAERADGFAAAVKADRRGDAFRFTHPAPASVEVGASLLAQAIAAVPDLDAIACSNDYLALGALFECQRRGIAIPEQLALVGFGDMNFSSCCNPALTSVRPSGDIIGTETARLILEHMSGNHRNAGCVVDTHFRLLHRQSS